MEDARDCPPKLMSNFEVPQGLILGPLLFTPYSTPLSSMLFGHAIPHQLYADHSQLYVSSASGDSAAVLNGLQSYLASVQSWMSTNRLGTCDSRTNASLCFLLSFLVSPLALLNLLGILGKFSTKLLPSAHTYQQSVAHDFTICRISDIFTVTLIRIVQNYLQQLLCLVISIIAIHFCMVSPTLTSQGSRVFTINWHAW